MVPSLHLKLHGSMSCTPKLVPPSFQARGAAVGLWESCPWRLRRSCVCDTDVKPGRPQPSPKKGASAAGRSRLGGNEAERALPRASSVDEQAEEEEELDLDLLEEEEEEEEPPKDEGDHHSRLSVVSLLQKKNKAKRSKAKELQARRCVHAAVHLQACLHLCVCVDCAREVVPWKCACVCVHCRLKPSALLTILFVAFSGLHTSLRAACVAAGSAALHCRLRRYKLVPHWFALQIAAVQDGAPACAPRPTHWHHHHRGRY